MKTITRTKIYLPMAALATVAAETRQDDVLGNWWPQREQCTASRMEVEHETNT